MIEFELERVALAKVASICVLALIASLASKPALTQEESLEETREDPGAPALVLGGPEEPEIPVKEPAQLPQLETPQPEEEQLFEDYPWDRYRLEFGGFVAGIDSEVRLGFTGVGIEIDLEEALDLDTSLAAFSLGADWRFTQNLRHTFRLNWKSIRRSAVATLGQDLELGDEVFPTGTRVESRLDIDIIKGAYKYAFFLDDRIDLGLAIGVYLVPLSFVVDAKGLFDLKESQHLTAPLPVVGLSGDLAITPRVFLRTRLDFFYLEIGDYTGVISDITLALEYQPWEHFGIGLGVETFHFGVEADGNDFPGVDIRGEITFDYAAAFLYGTIAF